MSSADRPIAVAFVHGILISDPEFHTVPVRLLKQAFAASFAGPAPDPDQALCIEPVHWAPALEAKQRELFAALSDPAQQAAVGMYSDLIAQMNQGRASALTRLAALFTRRWNRSELHWTALRWLIVHFIGDALAYPASPSTDANYQRVHDAFARALCRLGDRARCDAPLAVVGHSLGSIITSDFFYDLQTGRRAAPDTPIERGETLFAFHSLGSPMALWTLRTDQAGLCHPIDVPAPRLSQHHPDLAGGWYNYYDPDDVIASPLRGLSTAYQNAVTEDYRVNVGGALGGSTPLSHPFYWTDPSVMALIGYRLAEAYAALHPAKSLVLAPPPWTPKSWTSRLRSMIPPAVANWRATA